MPTPRWWKELYTAERDTLGEPGLRTLIAKAPSVPLPHTGCLIFPHTKLSVSGRMTAAVARSVIESECDVVVALGVLHGQDRKDHSLRGIHSPNDIITHDEFSLDNFRTLLEITSQVLDRTMPEVIERYPFIADGDPASLRGVEEIESLVRSGAALVATGDLIHHGIGYNTPPKEAKDGEIAEAWASDMLVAQMYALAANYYSEFDRIALEVHSDFRDVGSVVSHLVGCFEPEIHNFTLVNYADTLAASEPTWVAAALIGLRPFSRSS